jgi:hypothetical protein
MAIGQRIAARIGMREGLRDGPSIRATRSSVGM